MVIPTHFINVDLDLVCTESLAPLTEAFKRHRVRPINEHAERGQWLVGYEASLMDGTPESCTRSLLEAIAELPAPMKSLWNRCTKRDFNIGFECGAEPWGFESSLTNETLRRIADLGASVTITLYPTEWKSSVNPRAIRRSRPRTSTRR